MFTKKEVREDINIIVSNCLSECIEYALSDYEGIVSKDEIVDYFTNAVSDLATEIAKNLK